jgi:hypothetical protein
MRDDFHRGAKRNEDPRARPPPGAEKSATLPLGCKIGGAKRAANADAKFLQSMEVSNKIFTEHGTFKQSFYRAWNF